MKTSHRIASLLLPLGLAATLTAQPATRSDSERSHPRRGPGFLPHPIVRALDADKDREISAAEMANASAAILSLDQNNDGAVSVEDVRPAGRGRRSADTDASEETRRPSRPADAERMRPVDPIMLALDADGDRNLSPSEIANAPASLASLDTNKDGKLTIDEFRPLPPEGAAEGGMKGGRKGSRPERN